MLVFSEDFPCDIYFYTLVSGSKVGLPLKVALLNGMAGDILFNCSKWTSKMFEGFLVKQDRWLDILYHSFSIFFFLTIMISMSILFCFIIPWKVLCCQWISLSPSVFSLGIRYSIILFILLVLLSIYY